MEKENIYSHFFFKSEILKKVIICLVEWNIKQLLEFIF